ncbi:MAG: L-2-amino-thiazoline-4-carboxylic acid hydrolase, partial [Promethearchaeota archaeon]
IEIITFRWSIEGWKNDVEQISALEVIIKIKECPYKAIMDRNPERQGLIPLICNNMCFPFYKAAFEKFNPKIKFERKKSLGLGDSRCDFCFKLVE